MCAIHNRQKCRLDQPRRKGRDFISAGTEGDAQPHLVTPCITEAFEFFKVTFGVNAVKVCETRFLG